MTQTTHSPSTVWDVSLPCRVQNVSLNIQSNRLD